jgi:DNA (cytosine-5)-methyltransferase 3A
MKIYDLFTGLGGFSLAAQNALPGSEVVLWSEIDKFSIQTYLKNFPEHSGKNIGDIARTCFDIDNKGQWDPAEFRISCLPDVDLVMGGSPCQDLSIARGKRQGLVGVKSSLFFAFSEIVRIKKPKHFLLENVASMPKDARDMISQILGVEPIEINSDNFTAQKRRRLYWFNWKMDELPGKDLDRWSNLVAWSSSNDYKDGEHLRKRERETKDGRANTLTTGSGCSSFSSKNYIIEADGERRLLLPYECEELQGLPPGWTTGVSDSQRFKQIGNAVTVPVISHLLRSLK